MRKLLFSFLLIMLVFSTNSQIVYEQNYAAALKKSRSVNKPMFLHLFPQGDKVSNGASGLNASELSSFYNSNFVNLKLVAGSAEAGIFASKYQATDFPYFVFIDNAENLIFKGSGLHADAKYLLELGNEALDRLKTGKTPFNYDARYANGEVSRDFLREYINLRLKIGLTDNAKLIEKYVEYLTIAEFEERQEVLFIFRAGPFVDGKAYKFLYSNRKLTDDIFASLPLAERIEINNRIGNNTLNEAIVTQNENMAAQSAAFTTNTFGTDLHNGFKNGALKYLSYYKSVKDTAKFYLHAVNYVDFYGMKASLDSVKMLNAKAAMTQPATGLNEIAELLNQSAWDFYVLGTKSDQHLKKALVWSKRSIEIDPIPNYYDTLAHILYRMGFYDEAIFNETKAVGLSSSPPYKDGLPGFKEELQKMKSRTL